MAGSREYFNYTDDVGNSYAMLIDESNGEATVGGTALCNQLTSTTTPFLPRSIKKRYILAYLDADPKIKRRFWVGNPDAIERVYSGGALSAVVYPTVGDAAGTASEWVVTSYRGEAAAFANLVDTGLTEGDD